MIDLHTHTTESDGSLSPADLVKLAHATGIEALAITDHDTLAGFDNAFPLAISLGLSLVCGVELSTRYGDRSVHLLGYFLNDKPTTAFREWIVSLQAGRHLRNQALVDRLQQNGIEITLDEVRQRGKSLPGRPHFAAIMLEKGYVNSIQQAFDEYLDESGTCYISRNEPSLAEAIARITNAGGITSLPHPGRISRDPAALEHYLREMRGLGLGAIEAYHSDHSPAEVVLYSGWAEQFSLAVTGGSDFHGTTKPGITLGTGRNGNLHIPVSVLHNLRARSWDRVRNA